MRIKLQRYIGMGFFLLLLTGFTSCAATKAQNPGGETPGPQDAVLSNRVAKAPQNADSPNRIPESTGAITAAKSASVEISPGQPTPQKPAERGMRSPLASTPVANPPLPATQSAQPVPPSQTPPAAPAPPGQPRVPAENHPTPPSGQRFVLNFDNADLYEVIRVMAQMMRVNYIIDPRVKGIVNIHTSGQIGQEELFPIFQTILKLNGATAVQRGNIYEIVPFPEAKKLAVEPLKSRGSRANLPDEKYSIQIIPLKYIPVTEVTKIIKPFLSDGADIVEHPPQNLLIIGDIGSNIRKSVSIIELFDMDVFANQSVRIYAVKNADVNEVAKEMERIFTSFEVSLKSGRGVGITFTPISRINSLLVVSGIPNIFDKVESWLKELDRIPSEGSKLNVFVYYVQNGKAKDLADVLKQIYVSGKEKKAEFKEKVSPTTPATARSVRPASPAAPAVKEETGTGGMVEGDINIVVDETTNALIIRAFQRDYHAIVETIKKLDLYPKQVLIEVLLAEVTLDETTKYGLEWSTFSDAFVQGGRSYAYTLGMGGVAPAPDLTTGLRYSVLSVDRLAAAIHASATDNRLKVITSPHIMASNNKEAKIQIGSSQPILTNTYTSPYATTGTTVGTTSYVEGTIEYKDIGVILSVTPRISDGKLVTLDINIEQSSVDSKALGNLPSIPFFPKKTAKTTLSISEGQTIVIGGLLDDSKSVRKSGVPWLSKIPLLGALFGYHQYEDSGTETILMLTPHVITDLVESNRVTQEFRDKVGAIKRELESLEKKRMKDLKKEEEKKSPAPSPPVSP